MIKTIEMILLIVISSLWASEKTVELTKASHEAMKSADWSKLSEIYEKSSLDSFRDDFNFLFTMGNKDLQKKIIANFFGKNNSVKVVENMDSKVFFSSIYGNLIKSASVFGQINFDSLKVIGALSETDSLEHVLVRKYVTISKTEIEELEIISFKKINNQWKMVLSDRIKSIPGEIKASLGL